MARIFCTDLSVERGEPLEGSGGSVARYFFIKWPRSKWRRPRYETADLGTEVSEAMRRWLGNGRHIGFIDGSAGEAMQVYTFPDNLTRQVGSLTELTSLLVAWGQGSPIDGELIGQRIVLCCTDAKTDACCAKYGFSTYRALAAAADPSRHAIFQCTHIGGCHLAPSIMVMDTRDRYGRMLPEEASAFIAALDRQEYYLPRFKGRADASHVAQVVQIAVMRWASERAIDQSDIKVPDDIAEPNSESVNISVSVPGGALTVQLRRKAFEIHGSCQSITEGPGDLEHLWVMDALEYCAETPN
jgi:hypothetical protein